MKELSTYEAPDLELITTSVETMICTSPEDGGHEGVEYEDWI